MRRRGSALVEFGLVVGVLVVLITSVAAFAPAIATKSKVVDATFAAALEVATYRAPDELAEPESLRDRATQFAQVCRNASLVAYRMLVAAGLDAGAAAPSSCLTTAAAKESDQMWLEISGFDLTVSRIPASPFDLCLTYRYRIEGGIAFAVSNGVAAVDRVVLPSIPISACTTVYLDDDRTEPAS
jgi:hypothetical protein